MKKIFIIAALSAFLFQTGEGQLIVSVALSAKKSEYPKRTWCLSEAGIHANDSIADGKGIQRLVDSAQTLPGTTLIAYDEYGMYYTGDVKGIYWNFKKDGIGQAIMYLLPQWAVDSCNLQWGGAGGKLEVKPCNPTPKKAF